MVLLFAVTGYAFETMRLLFDQYTKDPKALQASIEPRRTSQPPTLAASMERPDKDEAISKHVSRFAK